MLSVERRKQLYAVCSKYDVIIVEDDPYWYLQFPSAEIEEARSRDLPLPEQTQQHKPEKSSGYPFLDSLTPSFLSVDTDGRVVRLDTFSKTIAPGCRLGWITAQPALIDRYLRYEHDNPPISALALSGQHRFSNTYNPPESPSPQPSNPQASCRAW